MKKEHLKEALLIFRKSFFNKLKDGSNCPCCKRFGRIYYRDLHSTMAKSLISLYILKKNNPKTEYFHLSKIANVTRFFHNASDVGKLAAWEVVAQGDRVGSWGITKKGINFVEGKIVIPKSAIMYEGKVLGFKKEGVTISDCLKEPFDISTIY